MGLEFIYWQWKTQQFVLFDLTVTPSIFFFFSISALLEISKLLNTGLDAETLATCVRLCENGVNPEALVLVIQELRRETAAVRVS